MTEETTPTPAPTPSHKRRRLIIGVVVVMLLLPATLYIPVVQDAICRLVVSLLNSTSDTLTFEIGSVRLSFPLQVKVSDVTVTQRADQRTLLHVGRLQTGLDEIPLRQPYFIVNRLELADVIVGMDSLTSSFGIIGTLDEMEVQRIELDLDNYRIGIRQAVVGHPDLLLFVGPSVPDTTASAPWHVGLERIVIRDGNAALDMSDVSLSQALASVATSPYLDYNHLALRNLNLEAEHLCYAPDTLMLDVNLLQGSEDNCGLELRHLAVHFAMTGQHITAHSLDMQLGADDVVRGDADLDLTLLDSIPRGRADVMLHAAVNGDNLTRVAGPYLPELQYYWPDVQSRLDVQAIVSPDTLDLRQLSLSVPGHADISIEGYGTQVFNNDTRSLGMTIQGTLADADDLLSALVCVPEKRSWHVPQQLVLSAEATQRAMRYTVRAELQQDERRVITVDAACDMQTEAYHADVAALGLNVQDYVTGLIVDGVTAHVRADGRHYNLPSRHTRLDATVSIDTLICHTADGLRDSLQHIWAEASLTDGNYLVVAQSQHPALQFDAHLAGCYLRDSLSACGTLDLTEASLSHLPFGLAQPTLGQLSFSSTLNGAYNWHDRATFVADIDSLSYADQQTHTCFDHIDIDFNARHGMLDAALSGGDARLSVKSDKGLDELPAVVSGITDEALRQLHAYRLDVNALQRTLPQIDATLHMAHDNPFYEPFVYETGMTFDTVCVELHNDQQLHASGQIVRLADQTGSIDFDTIAVDVRPCDYLTDGVSDSAYHYLLHAMHIDPRASKTYDVHAGGKIMTDSLTFGLTYLNGNYLTLYDLMASVALDDDSLTLHLERDPTLYEQVFTVNDDNYISLTGYRDTLQAMPSARARVLLDGPRDLQLKVYTRRHPTDARANQLLLLVNNLDISYATQVMEWDGDAGGRFNLSAACDVFVDSIHARLRSGIRDFHLADYRADTLSYEGTCDVAGPAQTFDGVLTVDSLVRLQLDALVSSDSIDVHTDIRQLPLPLVNAFLPTDMQLFGTTSGHLNMQGKDVDHAQTEAMVAMHDAGIAITDMDARLRFCNDTLTLRDGRLGLRDYKIYGTDGSAINVRGIIDMRQAVSAPDIDLLVTADRVQLIDNSKLRLKDQYICGRLPVNTRIKVKGTPSHLDVDGTLRVLSGTDLQYYMQDDPLQSSSKVDQLVDFVSFRQIDRTVSGRTRRQAPLQDKSDEGLNVELRIEIDKDAQVTAWLAGTDNNHVEIVGGGSLDLQCAGNGTMTMNGTYDLNDGVVHYKLPILPMVKTFGIQNSSQVYWQGSELGNPTIDILATEEVKATVSDDAGSRVVRFVVSIKINGTLDALSLTFDCDAPEDGAISSDIASLDVDERSKTALMLLIAQTYVGPGNSSSMGLGTANAALNSMLNREMDSMLGNMKGTDIDLGIDTYSTESGNTRTNYSVKVSQRLFNDRFRATVGGQISSGGDAGQSSGAQLSDMSIEWLIKRDGSHYMKLFRRTNYESVLEGELIETGISYVQERSGYRFRQLLIPTSKKRQEHMQAVLNELREKEEREEREARRQQSTESNETPPQNR